MAISVTLVVSDRCRMDGTQRIDVESRPPLVEQNLGRAASVAALPALKHPFHVQSIFSPNRLQAVYRLCDCNQALRLPDVGHPRDAARMAWVSVKMSSASVAYGN